MILEKFRPKNLNEVIGNKKTIEKIMLLIQLGRPILIYGSPGIGKTSIVYAIANQYGYRVYEVNASDERRKEEMEKILRIARIKTFKPTIILFDEVDGLSRTSWGILKKILKVSVNPVILTANNEYRIPKFVKEMCGIIHLFRPSRRQILEHIKKIAEKHKIEIKDYSKISHDVRNSMLALIYGAETYSQTTDFDVVKQIFTEGKEVVFDQNLLIWLMDNAQYFYKNVRELYEVIQYIAMADLCKRSEIFSFFPKGRVMAETEYPYFLRRVSAWKRNRR